MQLALFIREIDMDFNTTEELPALMGEWWVNKGGSVHEQMLYEEVKSG
jgi:hypothetical protein